MMKLAVPSPSARGDPRACNARGCTLGAAFAAFAAFAALAALTALGPRAMAAADSPANAPAASRALAQQSGALYGVEVIVFRASSVNAGEDWDVAPPGRGFGSSATRGGGAPQVVKVLAPGDYHLGTIEATLKANGAWRPIAHAAWIQTAANWGSHAGIALADVGINAPGLSGVVYLERAPIYLHLGFDVHLNAGASYEIKEMRSVRYNDKQYFDHPAFGIIALVTPIKRGDAAASP
jgi:hypothetical protein